MTKRGWIFLFLMMSSTLYVRVKRWKKSIMTTN